MFWRACGYSLGGSTLFNLLVYWQAGLMPYNGSERTMQIMTVGIAVCMFLPVYACCRELGGHDA